MVPTASRGVEGYTVMQENCNKVPSLWRKAASLRREAGAYYRRKLAACATRVRQPMALFKLATASSAVLTNVR
jgi:hypothetical protein